MSAEPKKLPNLWIDPIPPRLEPRRYSGVPEPLTNFEQKQERHLYLPASRIRQLTKEWKKSFEGLEACCLSQIRICIYDLEKLIEGK